MNRVKTKYQKLYEIFIILIFIIFFLRFLNIKIFKVLEVPGILILFFSTVITLIFNLSNVVKYSKVDIGFFFIVIICSLLGNLTNEFSLGGFILVVSYLGLLIAIKNLKLDTDIVLKILKYTFIFYLIYIFSNREVYNPNTIGQIAYICGVYSLGYLSTLKFKVVTIPIMIFITYNIILNSESRGAMLGFIIFIIIGFIVPKKILKNKQVFSLLGLFLTIGSIFFCIIYVYMWQNNVSFEVMNSTKNLYSGREAIWFELFKLIKENLIFGVGSGYELSSFGIFNSHNSLLNIFTVYGLPVGIYSIYLINSRLRDNRENVERGKLNKLMIAGFLGFLLLAFFENNLLWEPIAFQGLVFLVISNSYSLGGGR